MAADRLRSLVDGGTGRALLSGASAVLERAAAGRANSLAVLTYHRVASADERTDLHPGLRSTDPAGFDAQMAWLAANTRPVGLSEVLAAGGEGRPLPARAVHVTFDDGYADFATGAWPALRRHDIPATLFVPTAYPDTGRVFWWDRLHHAVSSTGRRTPFDVGGAAYPVATVEDRSATFRRLRAVVRAMPHPAAMRLVDDVVEAAAVSEPAPATLTWQQLGDLADAGLALAPHSRTHPLLHRIDPAELDAEVAGSAADLRARVPAAAGAFAYPGGGYDDAVVDAVARAGLDASFTTDRGVVDLRRPDWLRLQRINVGGRSTIPLIRAQLLAATHRVFRVATFPASRRHSWN